MAPNVTYVVDDQDSSIQYLCPVQKQTVLGSYLNNTWTTIADASQCGAAWFKYTFRGTAVRVAASSSIINQAFAVQIDNSPLLTLNGTGTYQSPVLADGEHTIIYAANNASVFPAFDFLTVTAGSSTSLDGRTFIVDDADSDIQYQGNWTNHAPSSVQFDPAAPPYLNTTHWTNTVGDSFTFKFTGVGISVIGVMPNATGNVTTTYTVDGKTTQIALPPPTYQLSSMDKFFHADLDSGDHTLVVNITSVTKSQRIGFDFILYNSTSQNSSGGGSGTVPSAASSVDSSAIKTGAIVGAVLGAVLGLFAIFALLFFLWRRRSKDRSPPSGPKHWVAANWKDGEKASVAHQVQPQDKKDMPLA